MMEMRMNGGDAKNISCDLTKSTLRIIQRFCEVRFVDTQAGASRRSEIASWQTRSSGDFWHRFSLELLDAFAWLTDRSGSRPTVRIQLPPPVSPRRPRFSRIVLTDRSS